MPMSLAHIRANLKKLKNRKRAKILQGFFKTGPGDYAEGDVFWGIRMPELRKLARSQQSLSLMEIIQLLRSRVHEERLLALLMLVQTYSKGNEFQKKKIVDHYLKNTQFINNWDLVDGSAAPIVGDYLKDKSKTTLYRLARSENLWERRIAIMATFHYVKQNQYKETLKIAKILLHDEQDLIQKAVGWMLREVGKRQLNSEERFLKAHYQVMPRTMLRYAIERFRESKRQGYLNGRI
jgi:3-methyladenine DNA glycosylase AlkD